MTAEPSKNVVTTDSMYYIHTDHLGSYCAITNSNKQVRQRNYFDPWGNTIDTTWQTNFALTHRGFTSHEHYPQFKIINMNGRLYDPVIARFFSPDNYVQSPTFTQSYNRYSYARNNPLKYVDRTGQWYDDYDDRDDDYDDLYGDDDGRPGKPMSRDEFYDWAVGTGMYEIEDGYGANPYDHFDYGDDPTNYPDPFDNEGLDGPWDPTHQPNQPDPRRGGTDRWSEGMPTTTIYNGTVYVVQTSTGKYINLTSSILKKEFDAVYQNQRKGLVPYFSPVSDTRWFEQLLGLYADAINPFSPTLPGIPIPAALQIFQTPSISEVFDRATSRYYEKLLKYYQQYNIIK
jgi:RHS repeat-associated protein